MISDLDTAFVSELWELLGEGEPPVAAVQPPCGQEGLLLASSQLVAETEALVSSCSSSPQETGDDGVSETLSQDATPAKAAKSQTLAERRKNRNANAAKRRLKYTKKVENERQQLKQQEKELSAELAELQAKQTETNWIQEKTRSMPVWRAIATRQLQGRLVAEEERRRLRSAVASRKKLLQELGGKVQQHLYGARDILQMAVDTAFAEIDDILRAKRVDQAPLSSFCPDPKHSRDRGIEYFENLEVQLVPFDFRQTGNALWQSMRIVHQEKTRQQYLDVDDNENVIVKFRVKNQTDSSKMLVWMVLQRRVEPDRTIILWRAHSKGEGELSDLHADDSGWSVVRPTDTVTKSTVAMPAAILNFVRFFPKGSTTGVDQERKEAEQFLRLAETSGYEQGADILRMMESLLLDDCTVANGVASRTATA
ncbi:unnamed protein product [Phytophthora lilii]|uniref:Unnamed protein product n=1 Tax=Phytophthora lilii TaxID=2077276 RepID=A0A9W6XJQ2_9STRA|nr:unnamed protein product [Phytophthora lilii]